MLAKTRLVSDGKTIMTEGNCEAFIGSVDLFLSLSAFFGVTVKIYFKVFETKYPSK